MENILKEISMVPGVIGSCIFGEDQETKCSDLTEHFSGDFSQTVGSHVTRLVQMSTMTELDVKIVSFRYDRYTVIGIPLDKGAVLLSVCEAKANCSLVATTASMLTGDIQKSLEAQPENSPEPDPASEDETVGLGPGGEDETVGLGSGGEDETVGLGSGGKEEVSQEMLKIFETIQDALAHAIGPVAGMVMEDSVSAWRANGPAVKSRLSELIDLLIVEINDSDLSAEFSSGLERFRSYDTSSD